MPDIRLLTPRELARESGWPEKRIRKLISAGELKFVVIGRSYYLPLDAIQEFVERTMVVPVERGIETKRV